MRLCSVPSPFWLVILSSCWSGCSSVGPAQRKRPTDVRVLPVRLAEGAYHEPSARESPGVANTLPIATGGGLLPYYIGRAIDAGLMAGQQKKFAQSHGDGFATVADELARPPLEQVETAVRRSVEGSSFFHHKVSENSSNTIEVLILNHGLVSSLRPKGKEPRLDVRSVALLTLRIGGQEVVFKTKAFGYSSRGSTLERFMSSPELRATCWRQAADRIGEALSEQLARRLSP